MKANSESPPEDILKVDVLGRVHTPTEQREAILDSFEQSGMPGTRFAKQHGIKYQTFASWVQKRRRGRGDYADREQETSPEPIQKDLDQTSAHSPLMLAEVLIKEKIPEPTSEKIATLGLRVELPGGTVLVIDDESQATLAAGLIRQLTSRPC